MIRQRDIGSLLSNGIDPLKVALIVAEKTSLVYQRIYCSYDHVSLTLFMSLINTKTYQ